MTTKETSKRVIPVADHTSAESCTLEGSAGSWLASLLILILYFKLTGKLGFQIQIVVLVLAWTFGFPGRKPGNTARSTVT